MSGEQRSRTSTVPGTLVFKASWSPPTGALQTVDLSGSRDIQERRLMVSAKAEP